jgi:DNA-binding MarR family transcriptional regulator
MTNHEQLLESFYLVLRKLKKEWSNQLQRISHSQYLILKSLDQSGSQKAAQLAELTQLTPGAITCASDKLVLEGYAERSRDTEDRRVVYVEITEKGRELVRVLRENQNKVTIKFFQGLPEEDIEHLIRIYSKLSENLEE